MKIQNGSRYHRQKTRLTIRVELSPRSVSIVGVFTRIAPVFPAGITRSARFVSCRQFAGTTHIFAARLNTMPAERFFTGKTRQTHFTCLARSRKSIHAKRAWQLFISRQTFDFPLLIL
jgi:hypothetical protein